MHRRFDWPSLELSRRRLLSFSPCANAAVEHESRSLIRAQALVRQIHFDAFIGKLNRDFSMVTRHQRLHSVIAPGNRRTRSLQFIERHQYIFIHGFRKVPRHPTSHGCIRLPLEGANPAKWFYDWIDLGTPISIRGHWPAPAATVAVRVEGSAPPARPFLRRVVIATLITIAGIIILFVSRKI